MEFAIAVNLLANEVKVTKQNTSNIQYVHR